MEWAQTDEGEEFHPGVRPEAGAWCRTDRPAGGSRKDARSLALGRREKGHLQTTSDHTCESRLPVSYSLKPEAKAGFGKQGWTEEPSGSAAFGSPPSWPQRGREGDGDES